MSIQVDHLAASVASRLGEVESVVQMPDAVRVTTHCMYPSNGLVRVMVRGGHETVVVSDDGEALGEALSAGIVLRNPDVLLTSLVTRQGLKIKRGIIFTPRMPISAAAVGILHVANVAKDVAQWLYDHRKVKRDRDFRKLLGAFLKRSFDSGVTSMRIIGKSTTSHKFSNVVSFPNGNRLIVDPVVHDPSSIAVHAMANLDVRNTENPKIEQRIVYDDEDDWTPADLNLLEVGAVVVPFSRSSEVISRIAERLRATQ